MSQMYRYLFRVRNVPEAKRDRIGGPFKRLGYTGLVADISDDMALDVFGEGPLTSDKTLQERHAEALAALREEFPDVLLRSHWRCIEDTGEWDEEIG